MNSKIHIVNHSTPTDAPRSWLRSALHFVRLALIVYLGVVLLLLFFENKLVFRPARAGNDWEAAPSTDIKDIQLTSRDGATIHGWWLPAPRVF